MQEGAVKSPEIESDKLLGDIIISIETAQRQADNLNHSMERELTVLLIHGLLHLSGYNHEEDKDYKIMREKEVVSRMRRCKLYCCFCVQLVCMFVS